MTTQAIQSSVITASEIDDSPLSRVMQVLPLALIITVSIFILMERLIHMADAPIDDSEDISIPEVYWEDKPPIENRIDKKVKRPEKLVELPKYTPAPVEVADGITVTLPTSGFKIEKAKGLRVSYNASLPIAQYMGVGKYPSRALQRSIEGFADVMFDVTEFGGTENIQVLYAEPEGYFEKAAAMAVARWRFQPKMEDDKPVRFEGMKNRIRFQLDKG